MTIQHIHYETLLGSAGKFGLYQIFMLVWYQLNVWAVSSNMTFMLFGGIFPTCANFSLTPSNSSSLLHSCQHGFFSLVMEFGLVGPLKHVAAMMASFQMVGVLVGPLVGGQLSDRFGRKPGVLLFSLILFGSSVGSAFSPSWQIHTFFRVLIGVGIGGILSCMFTLVSECLQPQHRLYVYFGGWPLGFVVMSILAMITRHWKWLTLTICLLHLVPLFLIFFVAESPKWLIERHRFAEAKKVLERICKFNRRSPSKLHQLMGQEQLDKLLQNPGSKKTYSYWHLFRDKESVKRAFIVSISWFTISMTYYGLIFYSGSLPGDPAINTLIFGLVRTAVGAMIPIADQKIPKLGRRLLHQIGLILVSLFLVSVLILLAADYQRTYPLPLIISAMGAMCFGALIWAACELFSVELFPTVLRNMGNAMCNSVARIGSIIAPQILLLEFVWAPGPMLIFLVMMLVNSVLAFFLMPETKGKPLPDLI